MAGVIDHTLFDQHSILPQTFLRSPILTLSGSLDSDAGGNISTHDLLDAYATLALRIRTICTPSTGDESTIPALRALKTHSFLLSCCVQRDIRRALEDPFGSPTSQSTNEHLFNPMIQPITQPLRGLICAAQDSSALCQQAIQVVSLIFRFPALYSLFTGKQHFFRSVYVCALTRSQIPSFLSYSTTYLLSFAHPIFQALMGRRRARCRLGPLLPSSCPLQFCRPTEVRSWRG